MIKKTTKNLSCLRLNRCSAGPWPPILIQWNAVITWSSINRILLTSLQALWQNVKQRLNPQKTPHRSPVRVSYGVSLVNIFDNIDRVIWRHRISLHWRHNGHDGISNHQPHDCLLTRLFRHRSKKTSKLRITGLCAGNSPVTGEFTTQMASDTENVFIWWHHHGSNLVSQPQA